MSLFSFRRRDPIEAARTTAPVTVPVPDPAPVVADVSHQTADVVEMVSDDLGVARGRIASANRAMTATISTTTTAVEAIVVDAVELAEAVGDAVANVDSLAASLSTIAAAGRDIDGEIVGATDLARVAETGAAEAGDGVAALQQAIARIETVVGLIAKVARQTTLLALNATIEAERAGTSGRGFAVVAQEVKALSVETQKATDEITRNIRSLNEAARRTVDTVGGVVTVIGEITPRFRAVGAAVDRQRALVGDAEARARETRDFVESVARRSLAMKERSGTAAAGVGSVRQAAEDLTRTSDGAMNRLVTVLRQTRDGDRRRHDRYPVGLSVTIVFRGRSLRTETVDLSAGGLLLKSVPEGLAAGDRIDLDLDGVGRIGGRCVGLSPNGAHVAFDALGSDADARLGDRLTRIKADYETLILRASETANRIGRTFEQGLLGGAVAERDLFSSDYRAIPGTDPVQVETPAIDYLERSIGALQEEVLRSDARMVFAAAVDRNGWLPVHNAVFSKPQRQGDPVWNAANARNKRIFDDRTGLLAARNTRPFIIQAYARDMGGGATVLMKEVDAPITVRGRHWGGFRTAYRM